MIEEIHKSKLETVEALLKIQEKYHASFVELKQVVDYALDAISSPPASTGTLTPKGEAEQKGKQGEVASKPQVKTSPATDLK